MIPVSASDGDNDNTTKKDDVQVTEIPLPDEDVPLPESELGDYEAEDDLQDLVDDVNADARQMSPGSEDNQKKTLSPILEESEPESSPKDAKAVVDPGESDEPKGERQTEKQTTVLEKASPQTAPLDSTALPQPRPESFPSLYVTTDRTSVVTLPDTFDGHAPCSSEEEQLVDPDGHGQTVPNDDQGSRLDDMRYYDYIVIGNNR
ncbi:hypothetical protein B0T20DRAFT_45637 [Sordaria brevicollis]|uniref:Uncharacterized protein n=1 Tax=Sordaria brevicollis TaxID=83679 RepID=A0AAE0U9D7_SORBR|nr:hypothetical protein B0T20DRAFT_45637 [Sordaria brevicollis]